jgi:peptidoglycan hydrolase-like protein with peptidoglycan-binding domain
MFGLYPAYARFRPLKLRDQRMEGEDVYSIQTGLKGVGIDVGSIDGIFGPMTDKGVKSFQKSHFLTVDGVVGPMTYTNLARELIYSLTDRLKLPAGLLMGQVSFESGLYPGNFSPQRPNKSYDAGVAQQNTEHTPPQVGFSTAEAVEKLAHNLRDSYDLFDGVAVRRRWELAAGHWNAPAFACYFAMQEGATKVKKSQTARPSTTSAAIFEEYMEHATAMMR